MAGSSSATDAEAGRGEASGSEKGIDKKEIHTYDAPWTVYGLSASNAPTPGVAFRLAMGSFIEEYCNRIKIVEIDEDTAEFIEKAQFDHPYPATKIMWAPKAMAAKRDILATTGDYLRLWSYRDGDPGAGSTSSSVAQECLLNSNKNSEYCAPLTSFDWNEEDPNLIGTSSIDTTCTIWDVDQQRIRTQIIAHDREVYDIAFSRSKNIFGTVGADGSLRLFDLRKLDHSTIMYETPNQAPMLRLAWNKIDTNYIACAAQDQSKVTIVDIRVPSMPVAELAAHSSPVNSVAWAPHSACHLCSGADDTQALIWDLSQLPTPVEDPILAYGAEAEINNLLWPSNLPDWVVIAFGKKLQLLRV